MKFSNIPRYTTGADDLVGCLGIPNGRSFNVETLLENVQDKKLFSKLTEKPLKIVAHYGTEPPQSNFVSVTTFFNLFAPFNMINGAILGIDILKPERGYKRLTEIENELENEINRTIEVYDLNPIRDIIDAYLTHFPLYPGCRFFEANTEYSTFQIHGDEKVEHHLKVDISYDKVFLLTTFSDELRVDKNRTFSKGNDFIPVWSQCQFIYANPPKEICPAGLSIQKLKEISFEEWKKSIRN